MIKVRVIEKFNLNLDGFAELKNLKRASIETKGKLYVNDEFECTEKMAKYLSGENKYNKSYIQVIEVDNTEMPKKKEEATIEYSEELKKPEVKIKKPKKKTSKKK